MDHNAIYRDHAQAYARFAATSLVNARYERPAMLRLAGSLQGRRVLELGCAAGQLTEQLVERGARVLALDKEPRMVELARERVGNRAQVETADLERPLEPVSSQSIDVVVASLVLHYLQDWTPLLTELHRCLVPGGRLVFSIHHPITGWLLSDRADYHRTELVTEQWDWDGQLVTAKMYRRPLSTVFGQLRDTGFAIDQVDEPMPQVDEHAEESRLLRVLQTLPIFLFVEAVRDGTVRPHQM